MAETEYGMILVKRTVRVWVPVDQWLMAYGDNPYDDGRAIEDAIEVDVEQWLLDLNELAPADIDIEVEISCQYGE